MSTRVGVAVWSSRSAVGDGLVLRVEVEQHADVTELEAAVDERDALVQLSLGSNREVDGQRRAADTALGREERDDLPRAAARCLDVVAICRDGAAFAAAMRSCFWRSRWWTCRMDADSSSDENGLTRNSRAPASIARRR